MVFDAKKNVGIAPGFSVDLGFKPISKTSRSNQVKEVRRKWSEHVTTFQRQSYESQNIFLLHNTWIEDQFSNMRGAWIIFCFTLHNLYSWKTTNSFPRASRSPEFNLPVSCCVYLHPHNLRHTLQKEPLTFVFWADVPQSNIEPIITKNPSFSGWKLSFEEKKLRKFVP